MPTRKIRDLDPQEVCRHPEHNPPKHMLFEDGIYEHECPECHRKVEFVVRRDYYWGSHWGSGTGQRVFLRGDHWTSLVGEPIA